MSNATSKNQALVFRNKKTIDKILKILENTVDTLEDGQVYIEIIIHEGGIRKSYVTHKKTIK